MCLVCGGEYVHMNAGALRDQERTLDLLELKLGLQAAVSHSRVFGTQF